MIVLEHPPTYLPERAYIAQVMLGEFLGIAYRLQEADRRDWAIYLQDFPKKAAYFEDVLFQTPEQHWLQPESLPVLPGSASSVPRMHGINSCALDAVPMVYGQPSENDAYFSEAPGGLRFGLDLFGSAFFLLTRYEEAVSLVRDEHARFPASASFASRAGLLHRPVVNEYLELLWEVMCWLAPGLQRVERHYRCLPTHDVDWLRTTDLRGGTQVLRAALGDLLKRHDAGLAFRRLWVHQKQRFGHADPENDPYDTFDFLMTESERRNLRSAFYFITDHTGGEIDGVYEMDDPQVRSLLRLAHERGHEIGLHPSYQTFRDPAQTKREFERLLLACEAEGIRQARWGGRQHYLRWENPTTWRNWGAAGLDYDSTLGYADEVGFRCGTCYEYPVYDLLERRGLPLRERPLIVMEASLFDSMGLSEARALERIAGLVQACRRYRGDFVLLWHNSRLASSREKRFYQEVLDLAG